MTGAPTASDPLNEFRTSFRGWLGDAGHVIRAHRASLPGLAGAMQHNRWLSRLLWDEGFSRWGWPVVAGGRGTSARFRSIVAEELLFEGLADENIFPIPEIVGVPFSEMASEALVSEFLPALLNGEDWWCEGFSEPGAGSDLANLSTRAEVRGDQLVVTGQKVWTTFAQHSERCILLARTGDPASRHRGLTALLVDMDAPGVTVRPIQAMTDTELFSEVFFDCVEVPGERVIGHINEGWPFAMRILGAERATVFWSRSAWLHAKLDALIQATGQDRAWAETVGIAYQHVSMLRSRSWWTQQSVESGTFSVVDSSIDKVLVATAEQSVFDAALEMLGDDLLLGDDTVNSAWREAYLYSRAASIYGGTGEIQRNLIAERLLGLPRMEPA